MKKLDLSASLISTSVYQDFYLWFYCNGYYLVFFCEMSWISQGKGIVKIFDANKYSKDKKRMQRTTKFSHFENYFFYFSIYIYMQRHFTKTGFDLVNRKWNKFIEQINSFSPKASCIPWKADLEHWRMCENKGGCNMGVDASWRQIGKTASLQKLQNHMKKCSTRKGKIRDASTHFQLVSHREAFARIQRTLLLLP